MLHGSTFNEDGQGKGADPDSLSDIYPRFTSKAACNPLSYGERADPFGERIVTFSLEMFIGSVIWELHRCD